MNTLVPYKNGILIPKEAHTDSLIYVLTPNQLQYEGDAAMALTADDLWICTPQAEHEIIPLQNVQRITKENFQGFSRQRADGVFVSPRDAWGLVIEYKRLGNFTYSLSLLTFHLANAIDWEGTIQQAVARNEEATFNTFLRQKRPKP